MAIGLVCGRGSSSLRSFAVAHRGGGDRRAVIVVTAERLRSWWLGLGRRLRPFAVVLVVVVVAELPGTWTSGRGFESHCGGLESV